MVERSSADATYGLVSQCPASTTSVFVLDAEDVNLRAFNAELTVQACQSLLSIAQVAIKHIPKQTNIQDLLRSLMPRRHSFPA